jgi:hypothetical protein|nr:MAG TPA_asm: hypothetical protein [Caudoviricetes sp.]
MSEYALSIAARNNQKKYGMSDAAYLIYADLRAAGWAQIDAWAVAFQGKGLSWPKAELLKEMGKLEALDSVQRRIAELQGKRDEANAKSDGLSPDQLAHETSKETILRKLVIAEKKAKYGSPDWLKIVSLEADYNKIKQDEIDKENNVVHFYLPVNYPTDCHSCLVYQNGMALCQKKKANK